MENSTWLLTNSPYNTIDVHLGSLVPDKRYPTQDAVVGITLKSGEDYSVRIDRHIRQRLSTNSVSVFKAQLTKLFGILHEKEKGLFVGVSAIEGRIYELRNPRETFKRLCSLTDVRVQLQEAIEYKEDMYFIIGYRTFIDARLAEERTKASNISAALAGIDPTGTMDASVKVGRETSIGVVKDVETPGERIYGVCYRKVRMATFKTNGNALLDTENIWRIFSNVRLAPSIEGATISEMVEAQLEDADEVGAGQAEVARGNDAHELFYLMSNLQ